MLALAMQGGRMGAWHRDLVTGHVWWSPEMAQVFGIAPDSFGATRPAFLDLVHPDDRAQVRDVTRQSVARNESYVAEFRFWHAASGTWRWMEGRGHAVYGANGAPVGFYGIGVDITDRKLIEERLRAADRRKDEFLATLAHELRKPLAPILNAMELMKRMAPLPDRLEWVRQLVDRQTRQLVRLVDELLDVSRLTQGRIALQCEPMSLREALRDAVEAAAPAAAGADLRLAFAPDRPDDPLDVRADPVRLGQVFASLLGNAVKFTPAGGTITAGARRDGDAVVAWVRDTGIGIAPEHRAAIFEMFAHVDEAQARSKGGLGIGLALARALVALHGGQLDVHSDGAGRGSEFSVRLPAGAPG